MDNFKRFFELLESFFPYLLIGVAIALLPLLFGLIIVFSHVLLWGAIIGAIIWGGVLIKDRFFKKK